MKNKLAVIVVLLGICQAVHVPALQADVSGPDPEEIMSLLEEQGLSKTADSNSLASEVNASAADFQRLRQELMVGQMQPLSEQTQGSELETLIEQLRLLNIPPALVQEQDDVPDEPAATEAAETDSLESSSPAVDAQAAHEENDILAQLEKVLQPACPLQLADTLFCQGYHEKALEYYQEVYEELEENDVIGRQWVLFQMANCLRSTETARAVELYDELIKLYPNSAWSAVAASRKISIEWNQTSQIAEILNTNDEPSN